MFLGEMLECWRFLGSWGGCTVLARYLHGTCTVLARYLHGTSAVFCMFECFCKKIWFWNQFFVIFVKNLQFVGFQAESNAFHVKTCCFFEFWLISFLSVRNRWFCHESFVFWVLPIGELNRISDSRVSHPLAIFLSVFDQEIWPGSVQLLVCWHATR